ncbi:MAG: hypothetical protein ABIZ49_10485 [Opitutaceae bacterium]
MRRHPLARPACTLAALLALTALGFAAEPARPPSASERLKERVLRMTELFDTMLPGVLEEHDITLHFTPKFSDLRDNEFFRFPIELRYGAAKRLELSGGLTPFTPNPFNHGPGHAWGPGEAKFGARYDLGRIFRIFDESTFGFQTRIPLGRPPVELNDHYTHLKPFFSAARTFAVWPDVTFYGNLSYDRSVDLTHRAPPSSPVTRRNVIEIVPGLLFKPGQFGYFAEYRYRHIDEEIEWYLGHEVQFGTVWDVPLKRSEKWNLPGKWQIELAYRVRHEEGRGTDQGISTRVSWRTTLREVLDHGSKPAARR